MFVFKIIQPCIKKQNVINSVQPVISSFFKCEVKAGYCKSFLKLIMVTYTTYLDLVFA